MPDPIPTPTLAESRGELIAEKTDTPSTDLAPLQIIRTETVFSKLPIHNLAKKGRVSIQITKQNEHGEIDLQWKVSASEEYGPPRQLAYKLDTLVINRRIDELGRPLPKIIRLGSLYDVAKQLHLRRDTNTVKKAILQNASTFITAKLNYKGNDGTTRHLEAGFTRYSVVFTGEQLPNGKKADAVHIVLNEPYWEVLNNAPVRPLNYDYLKSLPPTPQRFYEIISYRIFAAIKNHHRHAKLLYSDYCTFSAQKRHFDWERVRPQMYKVHKPHLTSGYLKKVSYEETTDSEGKPDWIMYYIPGPKAHAEYRAFNRKHLIAGDVIDVESEKQAPAASPRGEPAAPQGAGEREEAKAPTTGETAPIAETTHLPAPGMTPLHLVQYFHHQARGKENYQPIEKELNQATAILAQYGEVKARFLVDFAVREAAKTKFSMRTFGATYQYLIEAMQEYDYREMQRERQRRQEQQRAVITACPYCTEDGWRYISNTKAVRRCTHDPAIEAPRPD